MKTSDQETAMDGGNTSEKQDAGIVPWASRR